MFRLRKFHSDRPSPPMNGDGHIRWCLYPRSALWGISNVQVSHESYQRSIATPTLALQCRMARGSGSSSHSNSDSSSDTNTNTHSNSGSDSGVEVDVSFDIDLAAPAIVFAVFYTIMLLYCLGRVMKRPTRVFVFLLLFCASELMNTTILSEGTAKLTVLLVSSPSGYIRDGSGIQRHDECIDTAVHRNDGPQRHWNLCFAVFHTCPHSRPVRHVPQRSPSRTSSSRSFHVGES